MIFCHDFLARLILAIVAQAGGATDTLPEGVSPYLGEEMVIIVDTEQEGPAISPHLYGVFLEEINRAGDGGLYAELIMNRGFEENRIPEGTVLEGDEIVTPMGWTHPFDPSDPLPAWSLIETGDAKAFLTAESASPSNQASPISMHLRIDQMNTGRAGATNSGFWGISVEENALYDLTFFARRGADYQGGLVVSIESQDGQVYAEQQVGGLSLSWNKYQTTLAPVAGDPKARFVISSTSTGSVWFDEFSLFPRDTWQSRPNGLRPDLAQRLAGLQPGFMRFPGGSFVSGCTLANRYEWKKTVGEISLRPGHWCLWGYHSTDGLGYHEYLQLCEDLNCPALYVTCCGISDPFRKPEIAPVEDLDLYIQEALDAIEYALGPETSVWGALRAANGHPDPFDLRYIQIGNEHWGPDYDRHYVRFYDEIRSAWPEIKIVSCAFVPDAPLEIVDEHFYCSPHWFITQAHRYDLYDRSGPKVLVGEYAVYASADAGTLYGALAEAVFAAGIERNADVVVMAAYAPTFLNVKELCWVPDLILFNSSQNCCIPSYYVQQLFSVNRPDRLVPGVVAPVQEAAQALEIVADGFSSTAWRQWSECRGLHLTAGLKGNPARIILKVINVTGHEIPAEIRIRGNNVTRFKGTETVLTSDDHCDTNSFKNPERVAPESRPFVTQTTRFDHCFPAYSLTVFDLAGVKRMPGVDRGCGMPGAERPDEGPVSITSR